MLDNYVRIIDEIKDQILFITEDNLFVMDVDFNRFTFKTNDKLPCSSNLPWN